MDQEHEDLIEHFDECTNVESMRSLFHFSQTPLLLALSRLSVDR